MGTGLRFDEAIVDLDRLLNVDVWKLDAPDCEHILATVQRVRGQLSGLESLVSIRVDSLAHENGSEPAPETHSKTQGVSAAEARRRSRRSKLLNDVPKMREALSGGTVTDEHVDALAAACSGASDEVRDRVLRRQSQLTKNAERLSPEKFRKYCKEQVLKAERDEGEDRAEQQRRRTSLRSWLDSSTGMRRFGGEFEPELGSRIWNAIQAEIGAAIMSDETTRLVDRDRLAAEALGRLVSAGHASARPNRADVTVHVDLDTLLHGLHDNGVCELSDGSLLPPETVRRLACEANIIPVVLNGKGMPLDVGRSSRLATAAQRTALRVKHETCSFPRCDVPFDRCEVHHLVDWNNRGATDLANLTPVCTRHHHLLHEGGWKARLTADHVLEVWAPGSDAPADAVSQSRAGAPGSDHAAGARGGAGASSGGRMGGAARGGARVSSGGRAGPAARGGATAGTSAEDSDIGARAPDPPPQSGTRVGARVPGPPPTSGAGPRSRRRRPRPRPVREPQLFDHAS